MALRIDRSPAPTTGLIADRRLYVDRDRSRLIEEGSPEAAFLLATPDMVIQPDVVASLHLELVDGRVAQRVEQAPPPPAPPTEPESPPVADLAPKGRRPRAP